MKNIDKNYMITGLGLLSIVLCGIILGLMMNQGTIFTFSNQSHKTDHKAIHKEKESKMDHTNDSVVSDQADQEVIHDSVSNESYMICNNRLNDSIDSLAEVDAIEHSTMHTASHSSGNIVPNQESENIRVNHLNDNKQLEMVSYFESQIAQISTDQENDVTMREKVKNSFISIIDFIFYDKKIKEYTFHELTTTVKLKVIQLALTMDRKIEEYFPDYKESIKGKYDRIQGRIAVKYLEITASLCDKASSDTCQQAKKDFSNLKENFGLTWGLMEELTTSSKNKMKDFYENEFRN
ncbi:MAG: hypothetical protein PUB18_04630 [bacterium]|nr:hypothetical protein [bacterium]